MKELITFLVDLTKKDPNSHKVPITVSFQENSVTLTAKNKDGIVLSEVIVIHEGGQLKVYASDESDCTRDNPPHFAIDLVTDLKF